MFLLFVLIDWLKEAAWAASCWGEGEEKEYWSKEGEGGRGGVEGTKSQVHGEGGGTGYSIVKNRVSDLYVFT